VRFHEGQQHRGDSGAFQSTKQRYKPSHENQTIERIAANIDEDGDDARRRRQSPCIRTTRHHLRQQGKLPDERMCDQAAHRADPRPTLQRQAPRTDNEAPPAELARQQRSRRAEVERYRARVLSRARQVPRLDQPGKGEVGACAGGPSGRARCRVNRWTAGRGESASGLDRGCQLEASPHYLAAVPPTLRLCLPPAALA
jgi:hypothetical protein